MVISQTCKPPPTWSLHAFIVGAQTMISTLREILVISLVFFAILQFWSFGINLKHWFWQTEEDDLILNGITYVPRRVLGLFKVKQSYATIASCSFWLGVGALVLLLGLIMLSW